MGNLWFELTEEYYKSIKKLESTVKHLHIKSRPMKADGRDTNSPPRDRRSGPPGLLAAPGGLQCELPFRAPGSFSQADCSRGLRGRIDIDLARIFSFQRGNCRLSGIPGQCENKAIEA